MVTTKTGYATFVALVGLERLFELVLSARNARRSFAKGALEAGRSHYPVMAIFHTAFLLSCIGEVVLKRRQLPKHLGKAALGVAVGAQALRYWAVASLGEHWNTRVIVVPGTRRVTKGPYRYMRHPNYLAVTAEMAAIPLIHGAWMTAIIFSLGNALLLSIRIPVEERALQVLDA